MAITLVGSSGAAGNATSINVPWAPVGAIAADDVAVLSWNAQVSTMVTPTGWERLHFTDGTTGTHRGVIYYKVLDGTETGNVTLLSDLLNKMAGAMSVYRGVDTTTPIDAWAVRDETTVGTTHANPQITTAAADVAVLTVIQERLTDSSINYTAPSGYTKRIQPAPVGGGGSTSAAIADDGLAVSRSAGTNVTPPVWTNGKSTNNVLTWTIALTPATQDADLSVTDTATVTETPAVGAATTAADSATVSDTATQAVAGEPEFTFAIDWDGDDDFTTEGDDVTERVLARGHFTAQYGRDQTRSLSPAAPGRAAFELYNASRDYSPENAASPLAGKIRPARPFRGTLELDGATHSLFRGHTDDYEVTADPADQSVKITVADALTDMEHVKIFTELHRGITTGRVVDLILDAVGWPLEARDIDRGATTIAWWWENDTDALEALKRVVASEGPGATIHADPDGRIVFRSRHHRLLRDASLTAQATFRDGAVSGAEPWFSKPFTYDAGWRDVVNSVTFSVEERQADGELSDVWTSDAVHTIADGDTVTIAAQPSSPFLEAVTPVAGTDYTLISGTVTAELSRTSGQSTDIVLRATGGPASLSNLKLRARALRTVRTVQVQAQSHPSIDLYGERAWPDAAPWAGVGDAAAIASMILAFRAERLPVVSMRLIGTRGNVARLSQQAARDLSDRIHIVETETATDADYFIEQIQHTVTPGPVLATTFGCEQAPAQVADVFILGSATNGVLGTNRLGVRGIDDPDLMFVLGSASNGVLGANILAT